MTDEFETEPTSAKLLKLEINRFLSSATPEVMGIRGKWGVGKTYAWNDFLMKAKAATDGIALKHYAYVSLFGIQSLDELKYAIFENTVDAKDIGTEQTIEGLKAHTTAVMKKAGRQSIATVLSYFKTFSEAVKTVSFLTVSRQIICIDDIERKGKALRTQDVLGLVSMLRERRHCKIVLILNEEELEKEDSEQLGKYQEKVIDSSLLFAPTATECAAIALPHAQGVRQRLSTQCISLNVSNIRVIKKIERLLLQVEPSLTDFDPAVMQQAVQTLALFGWAHFGGSTDSDSSLIGYVLTHREKGWYGVPSKEHLTEGEAKWAHLLDSYGFNSADDFDMILLDAVRNGFVDHEHLKAQAQLLHDKHKATQSDKSLNDAWDRYHDSFDDNADEVVSGLVQAYSDNIQVVTSGNLNGLMNLLKDLGHHELAKEGLEYFMQERSNESRKFYDLTHHFNRYDYNNEITAAFAEKLATLGGEDFPEEILERIEKHQGWSKKDLQILSAMTVAEYKALFKKLRGPNLRTAVRSAVGFENIINRGTEYDSIIQNARQALDEIAAESAINKRRVNSLVGPAPVMQLNPEAEMVDDDDNPEAN